MIIEMHVRSSHVTIHHKGERFEGSWNASIPQEEQDPIMWKIRELNVGRQIDQALRIQASRVTLEI